MKTGFREHFAAGLAGLFLAFALAFFASRPSPSELLISSALLLAGSVLPDLDSPFSFVRRGFRLLLTAALFILALFLAFFLQNPLSLACPSGSAACFWIAFSATLVLPFILVEAIDFLIPGHRGPLHSLTASLAFGLACFGLTGIPFAGIFAFIGYSSHLALDFFGSRF